MRGWFSFLGLAASMAACAGHSGTTAGAAGRSPGPPSPGTVDFHHVPIASAAGGGASSLAQVLAARPALVNFWAPWCAPCVKELPDLERLARAMAPCGAAVVGVAVGESPEAVADFVRGHRLTYPQFADPDFHLADAMGQRRVPVTVVFDARQRLVFVGDALDGRAMAALGATLAADPTGTGCAGTLQALNK
ncbi:MAG: redoxin domain-containing protein [Bacteroidota bacterium]